MRRALARLLLLLAPLSAVAEDYPAPVQTLIETEGVEVKAEFVAPGGLRGYIGRAGGRSMTFYLTPDGDHLIIGRMMGVFGEDLSEQQIRQHLPENHLEFAWQALENAAWVAEGAKNPERVVYVFTDPNCSYCVTFQQNARPYLGERVQLRHVVVGMIQPASMARAVKILGSDQPLQMLGDSANRSAVERPRAGPPNATELRQKVESNNELMEQLGAFATPTVFYRDRAGIVRKIVGLPDRKALADAVFWSP